MNKKPTDKTEFEELSITSKKGRRLAANADQPRDPGDPSRRSFLGKVGGVAAVAIAAGSIPLEPLVGGRHSVAEASVVSYDSAARQAANFDYRTSTAQAEDISVAVRPDNGDATRFTDFSGNYSKALVHDALGVPNPTSWLSLRNALMSGRFIDFESIIVGPPAEGPTRGEWPTGFTCIRLGRPRLTCHCRTTIAERSQRADGGRTRRALLGGSAARRALPQLREQQDSSSGRGGHEQPVIPPKRGV